APEIQGKILDADKGTGKTTTALQALWLLGLLKEPGVVVGNNLCRRVWVDPDSDAQQFFGLFIRSLSGRNPDLQQLEKWLSMNYRAFFVSYSILDRWWKPLTEILQPKWLIYDESHYVSGATRTGKSISLNRRTDAALFLSRSPTVSFRICMTGSVENNSRLELWPQLAIAQPSQWGGSQTAFGIRYVGGVRRDWKEGGHLEFEGPTNTEELQRRLSSVLLRYTKSEIASDLPRVKWVVHDIDRATLDLNDYREAEIKFSAWLREHERDPLSSTPGVNRLRQIVALVSELSDAKILGSCKFIQDRLQADETHILLLTMRVSSARIAASTLREKGIRTFGPVHGQLPVADRVSLAREFASSDSGVYVAVISSVAESINDLMAARLTVYNDLWWNARLLGQAAARTWRSGAPHEEVEQVFMVVPGTIDDMLVEHIHRKISASSGLTPTPHSDTSLAEALAAGGGRVAGGEWERMAEILRQFPETEQYI
ncbi:MAG: hypothetical protein D6812_07450, partial [Deltaproteobacteria bacterium]